MGEAGQDFVDFQNNVITLTNSAWTHILQRRTNSFAKYFKNIKEKLAKPDYTGIRKRDNSRYYIQKRNSKRDFETKYLIVVVNSANLICTARFGSDIKFVEELKEVKK